jgi:hypothetical protein
MASCSFCCLAPASSGNFLRHGKQELSVRIRRFAEALHDLVQIDRILSGAGPREVF